MAPQPVEAVFFFRYTKQAFKPCYGRLDGTQYTKSFLQTPLEVSRALDEALGRSDSGAADFEFAWPGGSEAGVLKPHSATEPGGRVDLCWPGGNGHSPLPWRIGSFDEPEITIPGDRSDPSQAKGNDEWEKLERQELDPWLVAVKLVGEDSRLHVRAYLGNPPRGREHTGFGMLPPEVVEAMGDGVLRPGSTGTPPPAPRAAAIVERVLAALERDPNVLLVGPPGTGKTVALEDLRALAEHTREGLLFDPDLWHDAFSSVAGEQTKVVSLVFHPSYAYENFVGGLMPESDGNGGFALVAQPGPLVSLAHWARGSRRRALLMLDEFNRGPAAAIFGDTLALLDAAKRSDPPGEPGAHISRPHPGTPMDVAPEFADRDGERAVPDELRLPRGVQIVAALNSSDRSVAPLDAALRRRFAILSVGPDLGVLAARLGVELPDPAVPFAPADANPGAWTDDEIKELALRLLETLNERIASVLGEDFLLGHALLWPLGDAASSGELRSQLCHAFDQRIAESLRITFTDQDDLLAAVLGAGEPESAPPAGAGVAVWRQPPAAVLAVASPHLELRTVAGMPWPDAGRALRAVLDA